MTSGANIGHNTVEHPTHACGGSCAPHHVLISVPKLYRSQPGGPMHGIIHDPYMGMCEGGAPRPIDGIRIYRPPPSHTGYAYTPDLVALDSCHPSHRSPPHSALARVTTPPQVARVESSALRAPRPPVCDLHPRWHRARVQDRVRVPKAPADLNRKLPIGRSAPTGRGRVYPKRGHVWTIHGHGALIAKLDVESAY